MFTCNFQALEKAKEAGRKERVLVRQREQQSMGDQINLDLTYSVCILCPITSMWKHIFASSLIFVTISVTI